MDHSFQPSLTDHTKCARCHYAELDHSDTATCEACGNTAKCDLFTDMLLCKECIDKEIIAINNYQTADKQQARYNNSIQSQLERVKHEIIERTDIFNANIPSLISISDAIDADDRIENKTFAKANAILDLFNHLKTVIFDANRVREQAINVQRAAQAELNLLSSKLRAEEREKLKLSDLNYKPAAPKLSKPKLIKKPKFDKAEIKKYAAELGIPEYNLQVMVVKRGCTVEEAAKILREMLT